MGFLPTDILARRPLPLPTSLFLNFVRNGLGTGSVAFPFESLVRTLNSLFSDGPAKSVCPHFWGSVFSDGRSLAPGGGPYLATDLELVSDVIALRIN